MADYPILLGLAGFLTALVCSSLLEYIVHRLMHGRKLLARKHAEHHRDGWGQGVLGEFWDYFLGAAPVLAAGFCLGFFGLGSTPAGIGFVSGGLLYTALAAYAHQIQHERPELVFWLKRPVHYLHHKHHMWHNNFGILVDFWDRVFGTYKAVDWQPEQPPGPRSWRRYVQIKWF